MWHVRWLQGATDWWTTGLAQMKQTSASTSSPSASPTGAVAPRTFFVCAGIADASSPAPLAAGCDWPPPDCPCPRPLPLWDLPALEPVWLLPRPRPLPRSLPWPSPLERPGAEDGPLASAAPPEDMTSGFLVVRSSCCCLGMVGEWVGRLGNDGRKVTKRPGLLELQCACDW